MLRLATLGFWIGGALFLACARAGAVDPAGQAPVGHWPLVTDARDVAGDHRDALVQGVRFSGGAAHFDGRDSRLVVEPAAALDPGTSDFTLALWVDTDADLVDDLGDILSKFDSEARRGFHLGVRCDSGVTTHQSNYRHLEFGIDDGQPPGPWADAGRPGDSDYVMALAAHDGFLYAGTFKNGPDARGQVYRLKGEGGNWEDCGSPDRCNAVSALAEFDGALYAGVARYKAGGSALPASPNEYPGGGIYRYAGGKEWVACGKLGDADAVMALAVYGGKLFAIPLYHQGTYRYEGRMIWSDQGTPGKRMMALAVHNGFLYGAGNEGNKQGGVYRYDGPGHWTPTGPQEGVDQVYSFATLEGRLFVGTWPEAKVFRQDAGGWTDVGRLGDELEVMGMSVYNGKLYAGTLPKAEVYRYDGPGRWTNTGQLDTTPDVKYRRAWSMAVFRGSLYCGTLPSGHVYRLNAGSVVSMSRPLPAGWHHVAAARRGPVIELYLDGALVESTSAAGSLPLELANNQPLVIGRGPRGSWNGRLADVRFYRRALGAAEVGKLAANGRGRPNGITP